MSAPSLLIDLGNTRLKWALAENGRLIDVPSAMPWPQTGLPLNRWRPTGIADIVVASVAEPASTTRLVDTIMHRLDVPLRQAATGPRWQGLTCAYSVPARLGIDRWLALIAAYRTFPGQRCLTVSAGTALTVDVLDPDGRHRGGLIAPGLTAMREGLIAAAPVLASYRGGQAGMTAATDSADAIASGCLQAAIGLIERQRSAGDGQQTDMVLLSGGDAADLGLHLRLPHTLRPWLVLEGLAMWAHVADESKADR